MIQPDSIVEESDYRVWSAVLGCICYYLSPLARPKAKEVIDDISALPDDDPMFDEDKILQVCGLANNKID